MVKGVLVNEIGHRAGPPTDEKEAFGRRLYRLMLDKNMTQSDLSRLAGLSRMRISSYVRGQSLPTPLFLKKLSEALGVEPTDLLPSARTPDMQPLYSTATSPDGKRMRIVADVWVPTPVGAQIIQLLTDAASDRG